MCPPEFLSFISIGECWQRCKREVFFMCVRVRACVYVFARVYVCVCMYVCTCMCPRSAESESDAVIVHLRCLASIHASPQETAGSSNGTSSKDTASTTTTLLSATRGTEQDTLLPEKSTLQHARNHSGIVLATMTAIEALVEQSRLNSTQAASLQLWQPAKVGSCACIWIG